VVLAQGLEDGLPALPAEGEAGWAGRVHFLVRVWLKDWRMVCWAGEPSSFIEL